MSFILAAHEANAVLSILAKFKQAFAIPINRDIVLASVADQPARVNAKDAKDAKRPTKPYRELRQEYYSTPYYSSLYGASL